LGDYGSIGLRVQDENAEKLCIQTIALRELSPIVVIFPFSLRTKKPITDIKVSSVAYISRVTKIIFPNSIE
jgi:hypothetical protein